MGFNTILTARHQMEGRRAYADGFFQEASMWKLIRSGLVVALTLSGVAGFAQNTNSGDIRGTGPDATGAVVPGVTVKVQDVDKGVVRTFETDGAGLYDTGPIVPDHYLITFTK